MNEDMQIYYNSVLLNLEQAAKTNRFASKEEFNNYIERMKKNGMPEDILSQEKQKELLEIYDEYHKVEKADLNIQNFKGTMVDEQNYIAATEDDVMLKTETSKDELPEEFKKIQNELTAAKSEDSLANAKEVYHEMRDNRKEEASLIPLYEMIERKDINEELLNKIKFFITNNNINPYEYKISSETGLFYNTENDEVLEVRKNPETGQYEIVKDSQVMYKDEEKIEEMEQNLDNSEELEERKLTNIKVRRRIPPKDIPGQAAFVKTSILITICIFMSCVLSTIILLLK